MPVVIFITVLTLSALYAPQPLLPVLAKQFMVSRDLAATLTTVAFLPLSIAPLLYGYILESFTPRQMLSFGELYLNNGKANGRQVIPGKWIETSLQPLAESAREEGRFYGYGWWMRDMAGIRATFAWGYGGQFIVLVPELSLVIVTTSSSLPGDGRRSHIRRLYDLLEYEIIQPAQQLNISSETRATD